MFAVILWNTQKKVTTTDDVMDNFNCLLATWQLNDLCIPMF